MTSTTKQMRPNGKGGRNKAIKLGSVCPVSSWYSLSVFSIFVTGSTLIVYGKFVFLCFIYWLFWLGCQYQSSYYLERLVSETTCNIETLFRNTVQQPQKHTHRHSKKIKTEKSNIQNKNEKVNSSLKASCITSRSKWWATRLFINLQFLFLILYHQYDQVRLKT